MDSRRWEQIQALFQQATSLAADERDTFLQAAAASDPTLVAEVYEMLAADGRNTSLLDRGLPEVASQMLGAALATSQDLGPYRLKRILGEGGMGVVWLAERRDAGNLVAIKFLPHAALSPARRQHFTREIKTLGKLKHPFIARLYDAGTLSDGTPWFVMEFVEGERLTDFCLTRGCSIDERLRLIRKVCDAVLYAHGQEIIHRDLKPANILVEADGTPRLLDFGIAKELATQDHPVDPTQSALRFFSREYAAPEWIRDGSVGAQTDVYSIGVMLYELLTGRRPGEPINGASREADHYAADNLRERPSTVVTRAGSISPGKTLRGASKAAWNDLDVLCLKAIHEDPGARYLSVEALSRDVDHYLNGEPLEARPDTVRYRLGKFVRRNRRAVAAAGAAVTLVLGLVGFFTIRLAQARNRANRETAIATAVNNFLAEDLLAQSDPFTSGDSKEAFVDVVNQASRHIDEQFRGEPFIAGRLHQTIAKAFDNRSEFPRARKEYDQAADLFTRGEGTVSPSATLVRLQRATMEARSFEVGSLPRAKSLLGEAEKSMAAMNPPREDLKVWLSWTRGVVAITENDPRAANGAFAAAFRRAQTLSNFDENARLRLEQNLAFSYIRLGDGANAEPLLRGLIEAFVKREGVDNPNTLRARIVLAQALLAQKRYGDVVKEADLIYPAVVKRMGPDHETTLSLLGARAAAEGSLGMWDEAIRDDLLVSNLAMQKQGPASFYSIAMLSDAAMSQCRAGRLAEGETNARAAHKRSEQAFGPRNGLTEASAYAWAECLSGLNRLEEAAHLLQTVDVKAVTGLTGDTTVEASLALLQGTIAAKRGDYEQAQRYAAIASPTFERPDAEVFYRRSLQELRQLLDAHANKSK